MGVAGLVAQPGVLTLTLVGRDWLQQLFIVNTDDCENTQETLISFYFTLILFQ